MAFHLLLRDNACNGGVFSNLKTMKSKSIRMALGILLGLGISLPAFPQTFFIQHNFTNTPDGANPGRLTSAGGLLYGNTAYGGTNDNGTLYTFNTNGFVLKKIFDFGNATTNGSTPNNVLVSGGLIFGTTEFGGTNIGSYGTIYSIGTNGAGFNLMHSFGAPPDGESPNSGLILAGATLYGTANNGGTNGYGTIFKINTNGTGYATLHWFTNTPDGSAPQNEPVLGGSTLYGTASGGGTNGTGIIYAINTNGLGYTVLYSFTNTPDALRPYSGLVLSSGVLYGVGSGGGTNNTGAIFAINTNGTGYHVLYSFSAFAGNTDGAVPKATLTLSGHFLYGTTVSGGTGGGGTVFLINTNGTGFTVIGSFTNGAPSGSDLLGGVIRYGNAIWGTANLDGTSSYGTLFDLPLPAITSQPQGITVTNTSPVTFTVRAADDNPITYQWYLNTSTLLNTQTNPTLSFASATTSDDGAYTVVVSDGIGSVTSSPAILTVVNPGSAPTITQQPQDYIATNGYSATFTNVASGTAPLYYQWYFNTNTPLAGATNPVLVLTSVTTGQGGYYSVVVTNLYGSATSSAALLTVKTITGIAPTITQQPQDFTVTNGYDASFTNTATGSDPLSYQWYFNTNTLLPDATNAILVVTSVTTAQAGYYTVAVGNSFGSVTSSPAKLTVISTKPIILVQPQSVAVTNGGSFSFTVVASGQGPLKYQWYTNRVFSPFILHGETSSNVSFDSASPKNVGNYLVVITNLLGKATSNPAMLTLITTPVITLNPFDVVVTNGNPVTFTSSAVGPGPLAYQWLFHTNTLVAGATNTSLTFTNVFTSLAGYYAMRVTNSYGAVTSSYALLSVSNGLNFLSFNFDPASGSASFALANAVSSTNRLWGSTNLGSADWFVVASNVMDANGLWFFTDTNSARTNALRFYRFSTP